MDMTSAELPKRVPVLVVGAGPTGLTASALLADLGVRHLTVERSSGPTPHSKALGVQARTLELFERLGIAREAARRGAQLDRVALFRNGERVADVRFTDAGQGLSPYPYILALEQSVTEELLLGASGHRGAELRWDTEVISIEPAEESVTVRVRDGAGVHVVEADWVIGADGAGSVVRKATGQQFGGGTYKGVFMLLDGKIDGPLPDDGVSIDLSTNEVMAIFPLPQEREFRVIASVPQDVNPDQLDDEGLVRLVEKTATMGLKVHPPRWTSIYRLHHRRVERFRTGRLLLAGDSAHVHSPAGGQGMNTGIGDAFNLVWKLARVVEGSASPELLETYGAEREPFAEALLYGTDRAFELVAGEGWLTGVFKRFGMPTLATILGTFEVAQREFFRRVSQIQIAYPESTLSIGSSSGLEPGERAPDLAMPDGGRFFERIDTYRHHVVRIDGETVPTRQELSAALGSLAEEAGWVEVPADSELADEYGIGADGGVVVVRPDGHVGVVARASQAIASLEGYRRVVGNERAR